ncbi:MAG: polysaccharide deacetylase family protein [Clostridiaceae bacterium]|nr:polysaccharide deacetylase family protein [Clostridiaceae bacterium]
MNKEHNKEHQKRNILKIVAPVLSGLLIIAVIILFLLNSQKIKSTARLVMQDAPDSISENNLKQTDQQSQIDPTDEHNSLEQNSLNSQEQNINQDGNTLHSIIDLSSISSEKTEKTISESDSDPANSKESDTSDPEKNQPGETTEPSASEKSLYSLVDYNYIALTFDDGPYDEVDLEILDLLNEYNAHATFFLVGSRIDYYSDTVKAIAEQGSEIANHSFSHPDLTTLSHEELLAEINLTNEKIKEYTGITPTMIRPPYGAYNDSVLEALPYPHIIWNHDTEDWRLRNANLISNSIENTRPGSVILMHSLFPETLEALKQSLPILYEQNYRFVTVSELYEIYEVPLIPHGIHNSPVDELGY